MKADNFMTRCNLYDAPLIQQRYHALREAAREAAVEKYVNRPGKIEAMRRGAPAQKKGTWK